MTLEQSTEGASRHTQHAVSRQRRREHRQEELGGEPLGTAVPRAPTARGQSVRRCSGQQGREAFTEQASVGFSATESGVQVGEQGRPGRQRSGDGGRPTRAR